MLPSNWFSLKYKYWVISDYLSSEAHLKLKYPLI